ncbi:MAG: hypothetical protein J7K53_12235, partial [Bacteroidales bacterium]|nr:hypothetical protein [Bacteroidales bacterium]
MEQIQIDYDHNTTHVNLIELSASIIDAIKPKIAILSETAGLNSLKATIRITDHFVADVQAYGEAHDS